MRPRCDSRFLSFSALNNIYSFRSISLQTGMCNKFAYHFDVVGKSTTNQTLQLLYFGGLVVGVEFTTMPSNIHILYLNCGDGDYG